MNKKFKEIISSIENSGIGLKAKKKEWGIFFKIIFVIAIIFIMLFSYKLTENKILYYIILFCLALLHLFWMWYAIYNILKPSNNDINIDSETLSELISLNKDELELGLLELKHERNYLEKRLLITIGPIEKIGILPSFCTTILAFSKVPESNNWIVNFSYGYFILLAFSLIFYNQLINYDKLISLIEFAKKNK